MNRTLALLLIGILVFTYACTDHTKTEIEQATTPLPTATIEVVEPDPVVVQVTAVLGESELPKRILEKLPPTMDMVTYKTEDGSWAFLRPREAADLNVLPGLLEFEAVTTFISQNEKCTAVEDGRFKVPSTDCTKEDIISGNVEYTPSLKLCSYLERVLECDTSYYSYEDDKPYGLYVRYDMEEEEVRFMLDVSVSNVKRLYELDELFSWGSLPTVIESNVLYTIYPHYDN